MKNTNTKISSKEACTLAHQIRRETGCSLAEAFRAAYNSTSPVDPSASKTSWNAEELNKIFSDKAAELIRKGYIIDLAGMNGSQGEVGKLVFKKGDNYYLLIMEIKYTYCDGKYNEHYVIRFGKYTEKVEKRALDTWAVLWINRFDTVWSLEFVKITDNYFTTVEEAEAINKKWCDRCNYHFGKFEEVSSKYNSVILPLIRKQKGLKTVKANEIIKITRVTLWNDFEGHYNRHYYKVELSKTNKNGKNIEVEIKF